MTLLYMVSNYRLNVRSQVLLQYIQEPHSLTPGHIFYDLFIPYAGIASEHYPHHKSLLHSPHMAYRNKGAVFGRHKVDLYHTSTWEEVG